MAKLIPIWNWKEHLPLRSYKQFHSSWSLARFVLQICTMAFRCICKIHHWNPIHLLRVLSSVSLSCHCTRSSNKIPMSESDWLFPSIQNNPSIHPSFFALQLAHSGQRTSKTEAFKRICISWACLLLLLLNPFPSSLLVSMPVWSFVTVGSYSSYKVLATFPYCW